jgi:TonB family protein
MSLKVMLLVAASALPLAQTPLRAQANDAALARTPAATPQPAKWERFTYDGEEFSVELPARPFVHETDRQVNRTLRDAEAMRVFGVYSGGVVFVVASYDNPRDGETFEDFAAYPWGGGGGGWVAKGNVTLGGFAGKEYELDGGLGRSRVFRAKRRAYLVWARSLEADHPSVGRFLKSFTLGENPGGTAIKGDSSAAFLQPHTVAAPERPNDSTGPGRGVGSGSGEVASALPPPPPPSTDVPFRQAEVTRKAVLVYKAAPGFTEEARQNNVTGVVRLRAVLNSSGKVTNISVVKGLPDGLTERAMAASRRILFFPASKDGREVSQYVILEYNFNIY